MHWRVFSKAKAKYRAECAYDARSQGVGPIANQRLAVTYTFCPATRRPFDLDGLAARMKSGQDGLADVLKVDDRHWRTTYDLGPVKRGGEVLVEIASLGPIIGEQIGLFR